MRLVLLDDHDVARSRSVARLGQHPLLDIVGDAAECAEALELTRQLQPDAVPVDTRRMDKRGLETIGLLSALDGGTCVAIVAYVEILHGGDWAETRAAGADDVLLQEMRPDAIASELREIIDRVRARRAERLRTD